MSGIVNDNPIASSRQSITFPTGTKMLFHQTASPTGWTKVTTTGTGSDSVDDVGLRIVTGTIHDGVAGDVAFDTAFQDLTTTPAISTPTASGGAVQSHSITEAELDQHDHKLYGYQVVANIGGNLNMCFGNATSGYGSSNTWPDTTNSTTGSGTAHPHGFTQPTISTPSSSTVNIDINVKYVDLIIASKD